jgi:hypothetical protein
MKMTNQNQRQEISDEKIFIASDDPDFLEVVLTEVQVTAAAGHPLTREDLRRIELNIRFIWARPAGLLPPKQNSRARSNNKTGSTRCCTGNIEALDCTNLQYIAETN